MAKIEQISIFLINFTNCQFTCIIVARGMTLTLFLNVLKHSYKKKNIFLQDKEVLRAQEQIKALEDKLKIKDGRLNWYEDRIGELVSEHSSKI